MGKITIKKSHRGNFTAWAKSNGFGSVQEASGHVMANKAKYSPHVVEMANFTRNAASWN